MDLTQLEYFSQVAKSEHVSKAAEILHISQPSLSLAIRKLEDELGVRLFDRNGRRVQLNDFGVAFLQKVEPALNLIREGRQNLFEMKIAKDSRVSISSPSLFGFPDLMARINERYPSITITSIYSPIADAIAGIKSREIDFCIFSADINEKLFESVVLKDEEMVAIVCQDHPLSKANSIELVALQDYPFASYLKGSGPRSNLENFCNVAGFSPNIAFEGNSCQDILSAVRSGRYVSLVSKYILGNHHINGIAVLRVTNPTCIVKLRLFWLKSPHHRPIVANVRKTIIDYFSSSYRG